MKKPLYFQIISSIGHNRGGLTKAVYDRSLAIAETGAQPVYVLPFAQYDALEIFSEIKSSGKIPENATLISFYHDLCTKRGNAGKKVEILFNFDKLSALASSTVEKHAKGNIIRYFHEGMFIGASAYDTNNKISSITYHDPSEPWKPIAKDNFNRAGKIVHRTYLDPSFNPRYRTYYSESGFEIMSHWISPAGKYYRVIIFGRDGATHQFDTIEAAQLAWFLEQIPALSPLSIISEEPSTLPFLKIERKNKSPKTIAAIHTTHFKDDVTPKEYKSWFQDYKKLEKSIDIIVLCTNAQRLEIINDGDLPAEKCIVISHPVPKSKPNTTEKKGITTVTRLDKYKRIDHSIKAFGLISSEFKDVIYNIYGDGPERGALEILINKLGLQNQVLLHGYTNDPLNCFSNACLTIFTSRYEGFGLTLLESMVQACPVVAYSIKYGPIEVIDHEVNGILVEDGNIQALADALKKLLKNPEYLKRLSDRCSDVNARYSIDNWKEKWQETLLCSHN